MEDEIVEVNEIERALASARKEGHDEGFAKGWAEGRSVRSFEDYDEGRQEGHAEVCAAHDQAWSELRGILQSLEDDVYLARRIIDE